jgi:hypothetical protein
MFVWGGERCEQTYIFHLMNQNMVVMFKNVDKVFGGDKH